MLCSWVGLDHSPLSVKLACEAMSIRMFVENNSESKLNDLAFLNHFITYGR